VAIINLLACSLEAKTGEPAEHILKLLPGSLLGGLALDAIAGRQYVAAQFRRFRWRSAC
jgi:hypothetical protein